MAPPELLYVYIYWDFLELLDFAKSTYPNLGILFFQNLGILDFSQNPGFWFYQTPGILEISKSQDFGLTKSQDKLSLQS